MWNRFPVSESPQGFILGQIRWKGAKKSKTVRVNPAELLLGIKLPGPEPLGISGAGGTVPTGRGTGREGDFFQI